VEIDQQLRQSATKEIQAALQSTDRIIRAHAIEAAGRTLEDGAKEPILAAFADQESLVRFSAAMAAGQMRLTAAHDALLGLLSDPDANVQVASVFALHRLGDTRYSHGLEMLSTHASPGVRANVALALGRLEEPSAVNVLKPMLRDKEMQVELQAAEALWRLGHRDGLELLVAATYSNVPDDQIMALTALASPKNPQAAVQIRPSLLADLPEVALTAAHGLGQLGSDEGYGVALLYAKSKEARQRSMAALTFGAIGRSDAQDVLAGLLKDSTSPEVRLSAAMAILELRGK
jgi:HEAT repeat protein